MKEWKCKIGNLSQITLLLSVLFHLEKRGIYMVIKDIQLIDETGKTSINSDQICISEMFLWKLGRNY